MEMTVGAKAISDLAACSQPPVAVVSVAEKWLVEYVKELFSRSPQAGLSLLDASRL